MVFLYFSHSSLRFFSRWPKKLLDALTRTEEVIAMDRQRLMDMLDKDKIEFEKELESIQQQCAEVALKTDLNDLNHIYDQVSDVGQRLERANEMQASFNQREAAFNLTETE